MQEVGIVRISGLTPLVDIISSFQPLSGTISWISPEHPEGLSGADYYLVYGGSVAVLPDFTQATPRECALDPATPGTLITYPDPLPDPPLGQVYYTIIGVERTLDRRFGRQLLGSVLSGRNPDLFLGCT